MKFTKEQKLLQTIIQKAWEDESFKNELINSPIVAIEKLTGERVKLPEGKTLVVRDQTEESIVYLNIPAEPSLGDIELNEEQLEALAGGAQFIVQPGLPEILTYPKPVVDVKASNFSL